METYKRILFIDVKSFMFLKSLTQYSASCHLYSTDFRGVVYVLT